MIGGEPTSTLRGKAGSCATPHGFLLTGPDVMEGDEQCRRWPLEREPYFLESSQPGAFFAGDVRHGSVKRVASAVGEGSMAVPARPRYLAAPKGAARPAAA